MEIVDVHDRINKLAELVGGVEKDLVKQLRIAANATASKHRSAIAKRISKDVAIKQKDIKPLIVVVKSRSGQEANSKVILSHQKRPSLKNFGAKWLKRKKMVKYKIGKSEGFKTIKAFGANDPARQALGGHVYKRVGKGRLPIRKLRGISPWGFYVVNKLRPWSKAEILSELGKQLDRRIKALVYGKTKKAGL